MGKFDHKSDEGIHIGYVVNKRAYRVYNKRLLNVQEYMHMVFDESDNYLHKPIMDEHGVDNLRTILKKNQSIDLDIIDTCDVKEPVVNADLPKEWKTPKDLTLENVIGNIEKGSQPESL